MSIGAVKVATDLAGKIIGATPDIIDKGQQATEMRKWGKQKRKQDQGEWERNQQQQSYANMLNMNAINEHLNKTELSEVDEGTSLLGEWNNQSGDYNKYKNQVESELRKSGDIRTETYKEGKGKHAKDKTREVYSADIDNKRNDLYSKLAGYDMTRDSNNKLIAGQSWADVDKIDEAIIAGRTENKKKKNAEREEKVRSAESRFYEAKGDLDSDLFTDDDFKLFGVDNREAFKNKFLGKAVAHSSKDDALEKEKVGTFSSKDDALEKEKVGTFSPKPTKKAYGVNGSASFENTRG